MTDLFCFDYQFPEDVLTALNGPTLVFSVLALEFV